MKVSESFQLRRLDKVMEDKVMEDRVIRGIERWITTNTETEGETQEW